MGDTEGGFVVTPKDIYDEIRATGQAIAEVRKIVEPLPIRVDALEAAKSDHEARMRDVEKSKLSVEDYRLERTETDVRFQAHDKRLTRLETVGNRLQGAKGLIAWAGAGIGAAVIGHLVK